MGKALIIAEKPSVAGDIAKALGGFSKQGDYYESEHYLLSSAVGHLLELCVSEEFEVKRGKWSFANLPVIPPHFDLRPIERNEGRLKVLLKLLKRPEVDSLVNACDAGREGELIFRYLVQYAKANKPIKRLWLQSMTPAAIKEGFEHLRTDASLLPLADAAGAGCGGVGCGSGLADRHQRHAGEDGLQLEDGRVSPNDRRAGADADPDRKSTRLNSSHRCIS